MRLMTRAGDVGRRTEKSAGNGGRRAECEIEWKLPEAST